MTQPSGAQTSPLSLLVGAGLDELLTVIRKERDGQIVAQRFGMEDGQSYTLAAIGHRHALTRERIRQIVERGLRTAWYRIKKARREQRETPLSRLSQALIDLTFVEGVFDVERAAQVAVQELEHLDVGVSVRLLEALVLGRSDPARRLALRQAARRAVQRAVAEEWAHYRLLRQTHQLLRDVRFPAGERQYAPEELGPLMRARESRSEGFYSRKMGRLVSYDSRTEARVLQRLEDHPAVRIYQEQPLAIPYQDGDRTRLYYPDILMHLTDGRVVVVEIKPPLFMAASINLKKWAGMKMFCAERGYGLLITDGRTTLQDVMRRTPRDPAIGDRLEALIAEHGALSYMSYLERLEMTPPHVLQFAAIVIERRLPFQMFPFRLGGQDGPTAATPENTGATQQGV